MGVSGTNLTISLRQRLSIRLESSTTRVRIGDITPVVQFGLEISGAVEDDSGTSFLQLDSNQS